MLSHISLAAFFTLTKFHTETAVTVLAMSFISVMDIIDECYGECEEEIAGDSQS